MNIEITRPEVEALLQKSLRMSGLSSPEDVIFRALCEFDAKLNPQPVTAAKFASLAELLMNSPFAGADLNLERARDYPRTIEIE